MIYMYIFISALQGLATRLNILLFSMFLIIYFLNPFSVKAYCLLLFYPDPAAFLYLQRFSRLQPCMSELLGQHDSREMSILSMKVPYQFSLQCVSFCFFFFLLQAGVWRHSYPHVIRQNSLQNCCCADIWWKLLCAELEKSSLFQSILFSEKAEAGMEMFIWGPPRRDTYILRNCPSLWLSKSARALARTPLVLMLLNSLGKTK